MFPTIAVGITSSCRQRRLRRRHRIATISATNVTGITVRLTVRRCVLVGIATRSAIGFSVAVGLRKLVASTSPSICQNATFTVAIRIRTCRLRSTSRRITSITMSPVASPSLRCL
jgi:hypothetical protein